jgi:hypothetical protein
MNWGKWIALAFILFALFIGTLVTVCMRQDVSLVSTNYYEEDLQFQQHYNQVANANSLAHKPSVSLQEKALQLSYENFPSLETGSLSLTRPADSKLDHVFTLVPQADTLRLFAVPNLTKGLYKVRLRWTEDGKQFAVDETVVL